MKITKKDGLLAASYKKPRALFYQSCTNLKVSAVKSLMPVGPVAIGSIFMQRSSER